MTKRWILLAALLLAGSPLLARVTPVPEQPAVQPAAFRAMPIDAALFARIDGKSYKKGCRVPLSELRYLQVLHIGFDGETHIGELICNQAIADDLLEIFH